MKTYKVNLDYENYLFDENYSEHLDQYKKINQSFEYAFFLVNQKECRLKNSKNYSKNYLQKLKGLGFYIPEFAPEEIDYESWWGQRVNKTQEQLYNSKITSAKIALINHWGMFDGLLVSSLEETLTHLKKYPEITKWLIKRPHSFSGIGHYFFEVSSLNEETLKKVISNQEVLLEPVRKRIFDIGTTFEIENGIIKNQFMVENFNSENGRFKGAMAARDLETFKQLISKKYNYDLSELEAISKKIADIYLEMGCTSNVQIDSFIYEETSTSELKLYPLVEVNYRKTMGLVVQSLATHFSDCHFLEWKIMNSKEVAEISKNDENFIKEWIEISPEDLHFKSFYKCY